MVALTTKNLSLPHLSLSRTSSPSRSNSLNSNNTATSATSPSSTAPTSPTIANSGSSTFSFSNPLALDRKKSKSTSPKHRPVDPPTPPTTTHSPSELSPTSNLQLPFSDKAQVKDDKIRRSSFGASLSAFSNASRSASPAAKSTSTPAGLSLTPASAQWSTHGEGTTTNGGGGGGLKPLQAAIAKSAGVVKDRGGAFLMRSNSSDRAEGIAAAAALAQVEGNAFTPGPGVVPATKKKGVMGAVRGLALGQSVSQPAQSRTNSSNGVGLVSHAHPVPVRSASIQSPHLPPHSGTSTPTYPQNDPLTALGARPASQIHQLAESHVSQISLRLSETVNKVFMPSLHGAAGQQADKLEGAFFVPSSAVQEATGGKGRPCPRVVKSREFGEMLVLELQGAVHDSYLLKTILRSSVLKSLSLFLSRLSALLLVPSSTTDPSFNVPFSLSIAKDPKLQDSDSHFASNFPLALRYNLHIVRCATTVKSFLNKIAAAENGFPSFVEETLRPWRGKLTELIGRVMNPVVSSYKSAITEACKKSRIEGGFTDRGTRGRANSGDGELSSLGLNVAPLATVRTSSQVRSLSLGRSSTPTPLASAHPNSSVTSSGPVWLQETTVIFDICSKLFARLDAKTDADRWAVGIAIAAVWKGMLGCSARVISEDGIVPSTPAQPSAPATLGVAVPVPVKNRLLGGVKKTPSPPPSPPLPALTLASSAQPSSTSHSASIAFVRLIADLEMFEHRLVTFLSATLSSPQVVFHPSAGPVDSCPGAPSCGLCKTGRTFDEESDSSDDEDDTKGGPPAGKESRLALSAMREARQALSSMIVCVRAMRDLQVIGKALKADSLPSGQKKSTDPNAPLTPSDLFALGPAPSTLNQASSPVATVVSPSPAHPLCPTLRSAIIDLHPLILLHLVLSRLPRSLPFRLPHEIWGLRGGWTEYENELRGFAAGEEWAGEIAWEVRGEIVKVKQDAKEDLTEVEQKALAVLEETIERVSKDAA